MVTKTRMKPPAGLGTDGKALWQAVAEQVAGDGLQLDARERRWLADAASEADLVAVLTAALRGAPLMVRGSQNQDVANPLLAEVRQHREALGRLLARLRLDDPATASGAHRYTTTQARDAAFARWRDHG